MSDRAIVVRPAVKLTGTDGNVFALIGECRKALKAAGQADRANELSQKVFDCKSYDEALALMGEYVEVE